MRSVSPFPSLVVVCYDLGHSPYYHQETCPCTLLARASSEEGEWETPAKKNGDVVLVQKSIQRCFMVLLVNSPGDVLFCFILLSFRLCHQRRRMDGIPRIILIADKDKDPHSS